MYNSTPALVSFGLGGSGIEFMPEGEQGNITSHQSGYSSPDNFFGDNREGNFEGVPVIDKKEAVRKNPSLAITMPMVSTKLKDDEVNECPEPSDVMLFGLGGAFKALAIRKKVDKQFSGLDMVSIKTYIRLWREQGARIGVIKNKKFVWEN